MASTLFLILLASCSHNCQQWKLATIKASHPCSTYTKARLAPSDLFNGMEAELLCNGNDETLFFNVHILCFPPAKNPEGKIDVAVCIKGESFTFAAYRLEGGQRLMLPDEAKQIIVASLLEGFPVYVSVGRYEAKLVCNNFQKVYTERDSKPGISVSAKIPRTKDRL